ncbi:MAG: glycosyltransferase family 2 protein [Lachnospiraceae bacterium]|nr:glycosyltransferase family 2 protein [Lachnospiraceae bacterium]
MANTSLKKVSICIPVYNNLTQVKRCVSSILSQHYHDFQIIITDDSDNDEIGDYVRNLPLPVAYFKNEKKLGPIHNWNRALEEADSEYVKIFFSDDWFTDEDSLGKFVSLLEDNPEAGIAFSGSRQTPEQCLPDVNPDMTGKDWPEEYAASQRPTQRSDTIKRVQRFNQRFPDEQAVLAEQAASENQEEQPWERHASKAFIQNLKADWRNLFLGNQIGTPSAVIFRNTGVRFTPDSHWASDMFLYFDLLKQNPHFAYTEEPLICVGLSKNQYTHTFRDHDQRKLQDYLHMYEKYDLRESAACKQYLKEAFLLPYLQSPSVAEKCGLEKKAYAKELAAYFFDKKIMDYVRRIFRR